MKTKADWLANILDQTLDCVFIFDAETLKFSYVNQGATQQTGYSESELLDMTPVHIKPFFTQEAFQQLLDPLIDGREHSIVFQTFHKHKAGHNVPVEIFLQYIKFDEVQPSFVAIVRDTTERLRAEEAVRASEARFRILAQNAPIGIMQADTTGNCTYINQRFTDITRLEQKSALGVGWMHSLHADYAASVEAKWHKLITTQTPFEIDFQFQRVDDFEIWVEAKAIPIFDNASKVTGYLATINDISERRRIEQNLQESQKLESLGLLAGGIAHDFNNLLTTILGNASLASMEVGPSSSLNDYLQKIYSGAVRAAELCKQLLAYSGKGQLVVQNLNLNQVVEETTHLLEVSISKKAVLTLELYNDLPAIEADPTQIRQILMNLVINASEAIGDKSGMIGLSTGVTRVDRSYLGGTLLADELEDGIYAYLEVSDSGCGMSNETLQKIFDPFFSTKVNGRGLGLSASLGIMRGHKGTLKVYSETGRGTTFKLLFPSAPGPARKLPDSNAAATLAKGQGYILIVDDEESIRSTVAEMVKALGYSFALASDGREAVDIFSAQPETYDLVLMDLTMPHLSGDLAFAEMRKIRDDIPVILMSGFNKDRAIARFAGKGLSGFIEKPFSVNSLATVLSQALPMESQTRDIQQ